MRLSYLEKNSSIEHLKDLKYNQIYTDENMHFFRAFDIPKFKEDTPSGVSKAEYDCSLENIHHVEINDFINRLNSLII